MHKRTILFVIFSLAYVLSQFYRSTNAVIAPDLAKELSLDAAELGLMTSLFFAMFALAQIPVGVGLDRWGPRWVTSSLMWRSCWQPRFRSCALLRCWPWDGRCWVWAWQVF